MRKTVAILAVSLVSLAAFAQTSTAPQAAAPPSIEEVLKAFRGDMQEARADIMAKNLTLNADQAAKFWPLFQKYQQEQNPIMDDQLKTIQKFVNDFDKLDDAGALALINAHFDRDVRMDSLRKKWLAEFQKVLGTKLAVRVMQIDRRLSLASQFEITSRIPLVH